MHDRNPSRGGHAQRHARQLRHRRPRAQHRAKVDASRHLLEVANRVGGKLIGLRQPAELEIDGRSEVSCKFRPLLLDPLRDLDRPRPEAQGGDEELSHVDRDERQEHAQHERT